MAKRIADLIPDREEPVLEIGPGLGALSMELAGTGRRFVAVELDFRLAEYMERELRPFRRARVVRGDILEQKVEALFPEASRVTVIGNLPYSITTPALEWILEQGGLVRRALLMVQREFAERLTARPASKEYGSISVFVALHAVIVDRFRVSPGSFLPRPEVDSVVLEITPREFPDTTAEEREAASRMARASMGTRRKTIANALAHGLGIEANAARALLAEAGLDPVRRGETLSVEEFVTLGRAWRRGGGA